MRHGNKVNALGRKAAHRQALLSNMASSLILHKRIFTTVAKAKELKKYFEPLVTKGKSDNTHSRRVVFSYLQNKEAVKELFTVVADKVGDRPGGYTRILKTHSRLGDNAEMCMMELVDFNDLMLEAKADSGKGKSAKKRTRRGSKKVEAAAAAPAPKKETKEVAAETVAEVIEEAIEAPATEDLTIIEGIGPKIAEVLNAAGITTFATLAGTSAEQIREILDQADGNFAAHDPGTWPEQAAMAAEGRMEELKTWQDELKGGKETQE